MLHLEGLLITKLRINLVKNVVSNDSISEDISDFNRSTLETSVFHV